MNSVAILCFAEDDVSNFTLYEKLIAFLATEQLLLMFKFWVHSLIPEEADWVMDIAARNNFIVEKFAKGFEDAGDDMELDALKGYQQYNNPYNLSTQHTLNVSYSQYSYADTV